ncbi:MAG: BrnT family toxin [Nitrospirae bacterium]|nr:BrnT family toxin [Nitrospirota bacterium]
MKVEWDEKKNKANIEKHGISFREAYEIFEDPFIASSLDKRFDYYDERWVSFGITKSSKVIAVGHLYWLSADGEEYIRIITARKATKKEREQYEESDN